MKELCGIMIDLDDKLSFSTRKMEIFANMIFYQDENIVEILNEFKDTRADLVETENRLTNLALGIMDSKKRPNRHIELHSEENKVRHFSKFRQALKFLMHMKWISGDVQEAVESKFFDEFDKLEQLKDKFMGNGDICLFKENI